jgi:hypothetical protein
MELCPETGVATEDLAIFTCNTPIPLLQKDQIKETSHIPMEM